MGSVFQASRLAGFTALACEASELHAYQFLLLTASHSARHTAHFKEVEADPKYPASTLTAAG